MQATEAGMEKIVESLNQEIVEPRKKFISTIKQIFSIQPFVPYSHPITLYAKSP